MSPELQVKIVLCTCLWVFDHQLNKVQFFWVPYALAIPYSYLWDYYK